MEGLKDMKPVVMTVGKRARGKESPDKLTVEVLFPRGSKSEKAEIDLINGDNPQIIVKAPEGIKVETIIQDKNHAKKIEKIK